MVRKGPCEELSTDISGKGIAGEGTECAKSLRQELTGVIQGTERTQEEKYK